MTDVDFQKAATDAFSYILFDDFHEHMKYGEKHLDVRVKIAKDLFDDSSQPVKSVMANVLVKYAQNNETAHYINKYYCNQFFAHGLVEDGIEMFKVILNHPSYRSYDQIYFLELHYKPRDIEKLTPWVDTMVKIASADNINIQAKQIVIDKLNSYLERFNETSRVFD